MPARPLGPDSLTWRYFGDARGLLFAIRAGVLQAMHPAIDAALRQHSDFFDNPWNRLLRSAPPILGVVYDGPRAGETGTWIRDQHTAIKGVDANGASYHALSPDAFYWAHATFFESMIAVQSYLGNELSRADRERLYDESIGWYERYGLTMRPVPADYAAFERYWQHMLDEVLEPTAVAVGSFNGDLSHLPAPFPWLQGPAWWVLKPLVARGPTWIARGSLPPQARELLGLSWSSADEVALRSMLASLRLSWPLVPEPLRWHPRAWKAVRRVSVEEQKAA
ncbi:oxygenase MpaB family protein [Baekduia alba]|uniref:oxygenase MpaB family protein n=1 Tax=Baekduia alba TaxID=2997333 RepID=UPI002342068C|nr:oxygenase MpaB family protein [Baekduia alba]